MSLDFEKNAVKGNEFVRLVSEELEVPMDKAAGLSVLCSMHLRNQLSHEETFQLLGTVACVTETRFC